MRLYQPKYRQKNKDGRSNGQRKQCSTWWIAFRGPDEVVNRWGLETENKDVADICKSQIELLNEFAKKKLPPPEHLIKWVREQEPKLRDRIYKAGLLKVENISKTESITEHLKDYIEELTFESKSNHPGQVESGIRRIIEGCSFVYWSDADGKAVNQFIIRCVKRGEFGRCTADHLAGYFKAFANWMVQNELLDVAPKINRVKFESEESRAFTVKINPDDDDQEWERLLKAAKTGKILHGLTGHERYLLYLTGFETGLRKNELAQLTKSSLDFKNNKIYVKGSQQKGAIGRKKAAFQQVMTETMTLLANYVRNKTPDTKIFQMPTHPEKMIRKDCEAAGIETVNHRGTITFHSIRHTLGTYLSKKGVPVKMTQKIMRHSNIQTTLRYYIHEQDGDIERAFEQAFGTGQSATAEQIA